MKGSKLVRQLPSRSALNAIAKTHMTINDYSKVTPSTERDPRPQLILRKDRYGR
jgi:hypothetical protein